MKKTWKTAIYILLGVAGIWLTLRLFLPVGLPFLLGLGLARGAAPLKRTMVNQWKFPNWLACFLSVTFMAGAAGVILWFFIRLAIYGGQQAAVKLPALLASLKEPLGRLQNRLLSLAKKLPDGLAPAAGQWLRQLFQDSSMLAGTLSDWLMGLAGNLIAFVPGAFLFLLTTLLSAYFIASEASALGAAGRKLLPQAWEKRLKPLWRRGKAVLGGYVKAQLYLTLVVLLLLTLGLLLLRQPNPILLALVIALVDALPVFGAGTVLIPWGLVQLLRGNTPLGVELLLLYAVIAVSRAFLEPKFLGHQIGLSPLLTLISLYAGYRLFGVVGMILVPIGVILLKQLYDLLSDTGFAAYPEAPEPEQDSGRHNS